MNKKRISVILVVVMALVCLFTLAACDEETTEVHHKKAILIVTALTSGGLYDSETGAAVWDPLPADASFDQVLDGDLLGVVVGALTDINTLQTVLSVLDYKSAEELQGNWLWQVSLNENGESNNPNIVVANDFNDGKIEYGALAAYRTQCLELREIYGDEYDVDVFNYDWRIDNRENSRRLEEYINDMGYEKVVLTSHSMGGPVVAGYLARNQENRDKVAAYFAYSPANAGSIDALYFLDDPVGVIYQMIADAVVDISSLGLLDEALQTIGAPLIQNMTSVMQLLPSPALLESEWYAEGESCAYIDGVPVTADELYEFYCSRDFAKKADGTLKPAMAELQEYWDSFLVETESGEKVYATTLVNTIYCLGTGLVTKKSLNFTEGGTFDKTNIIYGDGDGTVPLNASLFGMSREYCENNQRIIDYKGVDHGNVGCGWEKYMRDDFIAEIERLKAADLF